MKKSDVKIGKKVRIKTKEELIKDGFYLKKGLVEVLTDGTAYSSFYEDEDYEDLGKVVMIYGFDEEGIFYNRIGELTVYYLGWNCFDIEE